MQLEKQLIPFRYILHQVGNAAVEDLRDDFKKGSGTSSMGYTSFVSALMPPGSIEIRTYRCCGTKFCFLTPARHQDSRLPKKSAVFSLGAGEGTLIHQIHSNPANTAFGGTSVSPPNDFWGGRSVIQNGKNKQESFDCQK